MRYKVKKTNLTKLQKYIEVINRMDKVYVLN